MLATQRMETEYNWFTAWPKTVSYTHLTLPTKRLV